MDIIQELPFYLPFLVYEFDQVEPQEDPGI